MERLPGRTASPENPINSDTWRDRHNRTVFVTQNAERVTQIASSLAFCVTDANYLLTAIWRDR